MKSRASFYILLLSLYVLLQFVWWGYLLVSGQPTRIYMVLGEGAVFLGLLIIGIWRLYDSIQKEIALGMRQNNFLLSVTHELKTPLSSVKLILQTLLKRNFTEDQFQQFLTTALMENEKSEQLIESLLLAARIESAAEKPVFKEIDLGQRITEVLSIYQIKHAKINFSFSGKDTLTISADPIMFESILKNLLDNSIKYGSSMVAVQITSNQHSIEIEVSDDGDGISETDAPYVFSKFYRSGDENIRKKTGTGLGLYLTKELVQLNKGKISFQKNTPKGTRFVLRFDA